ncbi:hypothetical protein HID58_032536 [Brassica napus]|uniref:Uncharacterized protein n=1 Tax=Brassica napus TaxID=3708 RepID=A0ABQ8BWP7_BRANA|nr:hypothetical protein HID58_032536 [Brassica napus]
MAEYYSEIVFPDPFESFFTYVCYYLAVHISNLPLGAFLLWCLLSSEAILILFATASNLPLSYVITLAANFMLEVFLSNISITVEEAMEEASKEGCVLPKT